MPNSTKSCKAFTLIEMMLVIFIIGVLAVLGLSFYERQTFAKKIQQTSLEMQQILQAASAFYIDNNCWPSSTGSNCSQCSQTAPSFTQYLPTGISTNAFGNDPSYTYSYHPEQTNCKKFQVLSGSLPSNAAAQRLAALLPSAEKTTSRTNSNEVLAEIATPSPQPSILPNYLIQYIGITSELTDGSSSSYSFTCPPGWASAGFTAPYSIQTHDWKGNGVNCVIIGFAYGGGSNAIGDFSVPVSCSGQNPAVCSYTVTFQSRKLQNRVGCPWGSEATGQIQLVEFGLCNNPNAVGAREQPFKSITPL